MTTSTRLACGKAMKKIPAGLTLNSYTDFLKSQMMRSSPAPFQKKIAELEKGHLG